MEWLYKYISATAIIAGLGFLIKYLIQRKIDSYFNKKLEDHKQELSLVTENAKYELNKKMFDFEAYGTKKHEVYPELYEKLFSFWRKLYSLHSEKRAGENIVPLERDYLLELMEIGHYHAQTELFKSEKASRDTISVLVALKSYLNNIFESDMNDNLDREELECSGALNELKRTLHKELSYSHFEE